MSDSINDIKYENEMDVGTSDLKSTLYWLNIPKCILYERKMSSQDQDLCRFLEEEIWKHSYDKFWYHKCH